MKLPTKRAITYGLGSGAVGALLHYIPKEDKLLNKKLTNKQRLAHAAVGGVTWGTLGAIHGRTKGKVEQFNKEWEEQFKRGFKSRNTTKTKNVPDWLKGAANKADARRAYHAQARKVHPDLGGSTEAMKQLSEDWEHWRGHFKHATYSAFADELCKIALVGGLIGGAAGYRFTPGGLKSKLVGTALGAGAGEVVGGVAKTLKRGVWDEQRARENRELYGYTSNSGQY